MSDMYEVIRQQMASIVPFATHAGVEIVSLENGAASARLPQSDTSINHIGSQHAGALFTLGEAASGAAMSGAVADQLMSIRPVAAKASINYLKIAKGTIAAFAKTSLPGDAIKEGLAKDGKIQFDVTVSLRDQSEREVATMTVAWHLKKT